MTDATSSSPKNRFGIVRIGTLTLGIPISHLSEVFHIETRHALPITSPFLQGGVELRGQLVPLLDMQVLAQLALSSENPRLGVIIESDGKLLAFYVDEVLGLADVDTDVLRQISQTCETRPSLFRDIFRNETGYVSVLNVAHIFDMPDVYTASKPSIDDRKRANKGSPMLTFAAGSALFAVPAVEVYAAVPQQTIHETAITSGHCLGEITYHGRRIPVACPVGLLGLGRKTPTTTAAVVILRFPDDQLLGCAVDEIQDIRTFDKSKETVIPLWRNGTNCFESVSMGEDQTQIFTIDLAKFRVEPDVLALASLSTQKDTSQKPDGVISDTMRSTIQERERYLVVDADNRLAIPLSHVTSILEPPNTLTPSQDTARGFMGYFARLKETVALIDLRAHLGATSIKPGQGQVLLTGGPHEQVGFLVDRMVGIELSQWRERPTKSDAAPCATVVQLGSDQDARVLPYLDLDSLRQREMSYLTNAETVDAN